MSSIVRRSVFVACLLCAAPAWAAYWVADYSGSSGQYRVIRDGNDLEVAQIITREFCSPWLIWGTNKVDRYLRAFETGAGCSMRLHFSLTWAQARTHDYFVLTPKHVIAESENVSKANQDYADSLPDHHETEFGKFKVRDKLFVDKIKRYYNRIWSMEYCEGFIAREQLIAETLARFSGAHDAEVLHYRTREVVPGWAAFYSRYWLPGLIQDETTYPKPGQYQFVETQGLYAAHAEDLEGMPDIFRAPQVYNHHGDSDYIVSKPVMDYWYEQGIKSFYLQPLLVSNTAPYAEYLELWRDMKSALSANPNNKIAWI